MQFFTLFGLPETNDESEMSYFTAIFVTKHTNARLWATVQKLYFTTLSILSDIYASRLQFVQEDAVSFRLNLEY